MDLVNVVMSDDVDLCRFVTTMERILLSLFFSLINKILKYQKIRAL